MLDYRRTSNAVFASSIDSDQPEAFAQSDQNLHCPHEECLGPYTCTCSCSCSTASSDQIGQLCISELTMCVLKCHIVVTNMIFIVNAFHFSPLSSIFSTHPR